MVVVYWSTLEHIVHCPTLEHIPKFYLVGCSKNVNKIPVSKGSSETGL